MRCVALVYDTGQPVQRYAPAGVSSLGECGLSLVRAATGPCETVVWGPNPCKAEAGHHIHSHPQAHAYLGPWTHVEGDCIECGYRPPGHSRDPRYWPYHEYNGGDEPGHTPVPESEPVDA